MKAAPRVNLTMVEIHHQLRIIDGKFETRQKKVVRPPGSTLQQIESVQ